MIKGGKRAYIFFMAVFFLSVLFSCSKTKVQKSFISTLDEIDALINQSQYKEALKSLEVAEKFAYSSWSVIGIYRRYISIGEDSRAEKVLSESLKKNPENLELSAVYTYFLIGKLRLDDALAVGKCLQGTKYGSIYAQAMMKNAFSSDNDKKRSTFVSFEFYPAYYDAYSASQDNSWLRNCALIHLENGSFENAAAVRPSELYECDDAYFWALVMYNARRFGDSINYIKVAKRLAELQPNLLAGKRYAKNLLPLEADSYTSLKDEESAQRVREEFIKSIPENDGYWNVSRTSKTFETATMFTNSARWAYDNGDDSLCAKYLIFCVNEWPDFVPSLCLYADFAYNSNLPAEENSVQKTIRDAGATTLKMEKFDNRAKIPLSDAKIRIEESLKRTHDPLLYIIDLDLRYKTTQNMSEKEKSADLWRILEENTIDTMTYPDTLLDYSISFLLNHRMVQDAWTLFSKTIARKYEIKMGSFWDEIIEKEAHLSQKEKEYAAYFAATFLRTDDALTLYQALVFETSAASSPPIISPFASDYSVINLAIIYSSLYRKTEALHIYSKVVGRCTNIRLKSFVLFRIASIYFDQGDVKNARTNAEYALTLNSQNVDARLLLTKINSAG